MATRLPKTDVVMIGLGAVNGLVAKPLAQAGAKIVALEAGTWLDPRDYPSDELRNDTLDWMGRAKFNHELPTWRPNVNTPVATRQFGPMMNAVGGSSIHYGTQSWRYMPWVFQAKSASISRYGASAIPSNSTLEDWPLTYQDLEPFYAQVAKEIGLSGQAGNVNGTPNPKGNTFEGPRSGEYPMPPLRSSGYTRLIADAAHGMGLHPFPGPAAINSVAHNGGGPCMYHGFCQPNGCPHGAKNSTNQNLIPAAQKTGNLKVITSARVVAIGHDNDGRANGAVYRKAGQEYFQPADVVLLGSYCYENARLLFLPKSPMFPNGLANNNGQVGKHYISHVTQGTSAFFYGRNLNRFSGTVAQCTCMDDFNADNFDHTGLGFIGGGNIAMRMEAHPIATSRSLPPGVPSWGAAYKAWLKANALGTAAGINQFDTLPYQENFLDLDPVVRDRAGFPVIRITFDLQPQEKLRAAYVAQKAAQVYLAAGASVAPVAGTSAPTVSTHAVGGTRMGNDPFTSVVDSYSLAHEVPNLMILGGSTFVSKGGHNPTLTMQALAWRSVDHLIKNWGSIAGSKLTSTTK